MSDISEYMVSPDEISKKLTSFGVDDVQAKVYLSLLGKTPQTILAIARELNLPRTTVYDAIRQLIEKGLVERIVEHKRQKVRAYAVDILEGVIAQEKDRLEKLNENLAFLKTELNKSLNNSIHTQVRYYHGASGFRQMMWNTLAAREETIGYSELGRVTIVGQKFLERWINEMITRKIRDRVIINPRKETLAHITPEYKNQYRQAYQKTRVLPQNRLYVSGDTTIYNNTFAVAWWKQGEVVGIEIENPELVKTQKSIFEILWRIATPVSNYLKSV